MDVSDPHQLGIAELAAAYRARTLSPREVTDHLLARIERLDQSLHAFVADSAERARAAAAAAEQALGAGQDLGPLHGVPFAVKDLFDVAGMATGAGCHLLADNIAERDCTVIERLTAAGMVLVGKTHTVQLAYGGVGINTDMGTPHNPWSREHVAPGGSSSGSAVAVAARMVPVALGSDTGGSVRIPASLCGITGLKTTVGQVSRAGVYPLSHSLDSVGPLARSAEDCAIVYEAIQGADPGDDSTHGRGPHRVRDHLGRGVRGLRLGMAREVFWDAAETDVAAALDAAATTLRGLGARVEDVAFPAAAEAVRLNPRSLVIAAEAYHHNRRLLEDHFSELDPLVATRMALGRDLPAPDYVATTLAWKRLRAQALHDFGDLDALIVPTTPIVARPVAELADDLDAYTRHNLLYLRNTAIGNNLGLCGLSVPCGVGPGGLPVGLMIYARPFAEEMALRIGHAFQRASDWHQRMPDLAWAGG